MGSFKEGVFVEEVFRRVAGDAKFREGDEVRLRFAGAADVVDDEACVALDVADGRVYLGEGDAEGQRGTLVAVLRLSRWCGHGTSIGGPSTAPE